MARRLQRKQLVVQTIALLLVTLLFFLAILAAIYRGAQ